MYSAPPLQKSFFEKHYIRAMKYFVSLTLSCITLVSFAQRGDLPQELKPFYHGVASGDPLPHNVILWTRVTPDNFTPSDSIQVNWRICTDTAMTQLVNSGTYYTNELKDFTVKIDAGNLSANTCYYYDFYALGSYSVRGRTRTVPVGDVDSVRFAVVSCSNYESGYFNVYRLIHDRNDIDVVLHLGDYIYEYEQGGYVMGRPHEPAHEVIVLDDYRTRYSHYRLDDDLRDLHQQYPFITIWDDHESANNAHENGAENHTPGLEGTWADRKQNARQAYFEWMPVRENNQEPHRLYRHFSFGNLIKLCMLDTRLEGRSEQVATNSPDIDSPSRTLLGAVQYDWLVNQLDTSSTQWNILGQQVMMAPLEWLGTPLNADQWDGYAYERDQLYNDILVRGINNIVVLTGDIHTSWANDLPLAGYDPGSGANSLGVEFVVTSVTTPGVAVGAGTSGVIQAANPHMKWIDLTQHGYMVLDVNKTRVQGEWYFVDDIIVPSFNESLGNVFYTNDGDNRLSITSLISARDGTDCHLAPPLPIAVTHIAEEQTHTFIGLYPNPAQTEVLLQIHSTKALTTEVMLLGVDGRTLRSFQLPLAQGLNYLRMEVNDLAAGVYAIQLMNAETSTTKLFVKE